MCKKNKISNTDCSCKNCGVNMEKHVNEIKMYHGKSIKSFFTFQYFCNTCGYLSYPKHY
jgi:hypothetical protein